MGFQSASYATREGLETMVIIRSQEEIRKIERSSQILVEVVDSVEPLIAPGITTRQIDEEIELRIREKGGVPAMKGYRGYPCCSCTNINDEVVNSMPSMIKLENGDLFKLQVGISIDGYFSKIQHAYAIGNLPTNRKKLLLGATRALHAGLSQAVPGKRVSDIGHAIQTLAEQNGYSVVREFVGHGIGTQLHEEPQVPNYGEPGRGLRVMKGMVLQVLPIINEGFQHVKVSGDQWTVVTMDGSDSCLIGHVIAIERDGPRILTFTPRAAGCPRVFTSPEVE